MIHKRSAYGGPIYGRRLASRSRSLACAVCRGATAQDAGPDVPSLCRGFDWSRRPQERSTDGGARQWGRLRSAPSFRRCRSLGRAPLEAALLKEADRLVGDDTGFLVIDDTALPKKGRHSIGVAPQYASSLGKTANCQSLEQIPADVGHRLYPAW